jgi:hypothetical protein
MKALFFAVVAVVLTGCFTPEGEVASEPNLSVEEHELSTCTVQCGNGTSLSCTSAINCYSTVNSVNCQTNNWGWQSATCQASGPYCGDGICNNGESYPSCSDCPAPQPRCGDGICNGSETWQTCSDCPPPGPYCGDGICNGGEAWWNCDDCPNNCPTCPIP